jgi:hypothetical protein
MTSPTFTSWIDDGVHATKSPVIRLGLIESDDTISTGKIAPDDTDKILVRIRNMTEKNNKFPTNDFNDSLTSPRLHRHDTEYDHS